MPNPLAAFNWLDLVIFLIVGVSLAIGFMQGILRQVIGLAAFYIAITLAAQYYAPLSDFVQRILFQPTSRFLNAITFFVIVVVVWLLITWLAFDAYRSTKFHFLPAIDQLGGSLVSLATTLAALALIAPVVNFMVSEPWPGAEVVQQTLSSAFKTSVLVKQLLLLKDHLINAITPWLPYGIPSIFKF